VLDDLVVVRDENEKAVGSLSLHHVEEAIVSCVSSHSRGSIHVAEDKGEKRAL
jgi:hypothetical protein